MTSNTKCLSFSLFPSGDKQKVIRDKMPLEETQPGGVVYNYNYYDSSNNNRIAVTSGR